MIENESGPDANLWPPPALPASSLPPADFPTLLLSQATPSERFSCFILNAAEFKGFLTLPQYLSREDHLSNQALTKGGGITHWILTNSATPLEDQDRPIFASCESLRKSVLVARDGSVEEKVGHGIASVFCRREYRGRKYAGRMMKELGKILETWQPLPGEERTAFSVLYSDIGKDFYAREGWAAMPSSHLQLPPLDETSYEDSRQRLRLPDVFDFKACDLRDKVCKPDIKHVRATLAHTSDATPSKTFVAIRPDEEHMVWHHSREEIQCEALSRDQPVIKGSAVKDTLNKPLSTSIVWTRVYQTDASENILHILRLVIPSDSTPDMVPATAALLLRAQLEAHRWGMLGGVQLWNPAETTIQAARLLAGVEKEVNIIVREKESIASLRWHGGGDDNIEWLFNEKYGWC